jgi:hypothetical protein
MLAATSNIPAWIAAIGGSVSLLLAFRILLRDRARALAEQASQVACWRRIQFLSYTPLDAEDDDDMETVAIHDEVHVHNSSDRPITDVRHRHRRMSKRKVRRTFDQRDLEEFKTQPVYDVSTNLGVGLLEPDTPQYRGAVMPGESAIQEFADPNMDESTEGDPATQYQHRWVYFRDSNGIEWVRDLADGKLLRGGGPHHRYRLRRGWGWQTLFVRQAREAFRWWEHA